MKRRFVWIFIFLGLGLVAYAVWGKKWRSAAGKPPQVRAHAVHPIETGHPARRDFSLLLPWFGRTQSEKVVKIKAPISGRIISLDAADGACTKKGDKLFTLGGPLVQATTQAMREQIKNLEKQIAPAQRLVQVKQKAVAEKMAKKEELLAAEQSLTRLQGDVAVLRRKLVATRDLLTIRSPIDGIFVNRLVAVGQDVDQGAHLADVVARDLRIVARVFPPDGVSLQGKTVSVRAPSGHAIRATVARVLPQRTAEGATILWITGSDLGKSLKPAESVCGDVLIEVHKKSLAVPVGAVVRDEEERTFVFVKKAGGYEKRAVKTGLVSGGWCEILQGLSEDEVVVVRGAYELLYQDFSKTYKVAD